MAHQIPDFETTDLQGKTLHYNGTVGLTAVPVPSVIVSKIANVLIRNPNSNGITEVLYFSFDGGANFVSLARGEFAGWSPRNTASNSPITQIYVKGSTSAVDYEIVMDFEP